MARTPLPRALKLIKGTLDPRTDNPREPQPVGDLVEPPDWMTDDQKSLWKKTLANSPGGLLKLLDESIFTAWVISADIHRQASMELAKAQLTSTSRDGNTRASVYIHIIGKQAQMMKALGAELGFSPVARSKVVMPEDDKSRELENEFFG